METQDLASTPRAEILARAVDSASSAILVTDLDLCLLHANEGLARMFGYTEHELAGKRLADVLARAQTDQDELEQLLARSKARQDVRTQLLLYRKDGSPLWVSITVNPVGIECHGPGHLVAVLTDITHAKMHEVLHDRVLDALVRERPLFDVMTAICQELERIAPSLRASVVALDGDNCLRHLASPSLPHSYCEQIEGLAIGPNVGPYGAAAWHGRTFVVDDTGTDQTFEDFRFIPQIHGLNAFWSSPIKSSGGSVLGVFAFYYREQRRPDPWHTKLAEICLHLCSLALEREQTRRQMHQLAFYDSLTGLPNRTMFSARAEQLLDDAQSSGVPAAIVFIDVDRFKRINETQGHAAGDGLLRDIAQRLAGALGDGDLLGHQSGAELMVALPNCSTEHAAVVVERLLTTVSAPSVVGHMTFHPSASIGLAMFPHDGRDIGTLLRHADLAAHRAKAEGGGTFRFFSADMNQLAQERLALETALSEAIHHNQLHLHFQPQLGSEPPHALLGVEALLRWDHLELGAVAPTRFIPLAEECGLMTELTRWVLANACKQMADWRARGIGVPWISVNLSPSNFEDPGLVEHLQLLLQTHRLSPRELVLEMTESVMLTANPIVLENLEAISKAGLSLSLDDFGTGYSSLSHLHRLPIDELKLDMSFVHDLERSESARTLTNSILRIGESLGKRVVAEGVETEAQRKLLADLGCEVLQGFLFSRPLPPAEFEMWIAGRES